MREYVQVLNVEQERKVQGSTGKGQKADVVLRDEDCGGETRQTEGTGNQFMEFLVGGVMGTTITSK